MVVLVGTFAGKTTRGLVKREWGGRGVRSKWMLFHKHVSDSFSNYHLVGFS